MLEASSSPRRGSLAVGRDDAGIRECFGHCGRSFLATRATVRLHVVAIQPNFDVLEPRLPIAVVEVGEVSALNAVLESALGVLTLDRDAVALRGPVDDEFTNRVFFRCLDVDVELVQLDLPLASRTRRFVRDRLARPDLHLDQADRPLADVRGDLVEKVHLDRVDHGADRRVGVLPMVGRLGRGQFRSFRQLDSADEGVEDVGPHASREPTRLRGILRHIEIGDQVREKRFELGGGLHLETPAASERPYSVVRSW